MGRFVSERTKQCKTNTVVFTILHLLCLFGPLLYFIPYGYISGEITEKIVMSFTVVVSIIMAVISAIVSVTSRAGLHRCILWTLIAGVLFCLQEVQTFIWIMCITSVLDELVFVKIRDHFKTALAANIEIDRRQ
jgi:hypothetical protein